MRMNKDTCARMSMSLAVALAFCGAAALAQEPVRQQESYQTLYLKNATSQNAANDIQTAMRRSITRRRKMV
jgi:hypothetical protein